MATLTISLAGSGIVNGTKVYNVTDADVQRVLNWAVVEFANKLPAPPAIPTSQQILLQWVQNWIDTTKMKEQMFSTVQPLPAVPQSLGFN